MVAPGQAIDVTLRWPNKFVAGDRPHRVLECATTNGGAAWQWAERRMVTAEGTTTLSVAVPSGMDGGSKVCAQSILVTKGSFGPVRRWSETTCHRVAAVEKKVMEPLVRRDDDEPTTSPTSTKDEYEEEKGRREEEKKRKDEERRRKEEESRKTTTTVKTEVTLPPSTSPPETSTSTTTAPLAPIVDAPAPPRAPQAVPSPPPPKAPVVSRPAGQAATRPQAGAAPPAAQLARTGTGLLGLFLLGGVSLITGRLLRRAFPARDARGGRSPAPEALPEARDQVSGQP